jgi:FkbM family methyltransferase
MNSEITEALNTVRRILLNNPNTAAAVERLGAIAQGKGFGTSTIQQEVEIASRLLNGHIQLAIDIGANIGEYTRALTQFHPDVEVHLFEPSKHNFDLLLDKFQNRSRYFINSEAVSDRSGNAILFSDAIGSGLASLQSRELSHRGINLSIKEPVTTIRFDDYWEQILSERRIDLVKIDVEGLEMNVLVGFGSTLKYCRGIQFEFGGCNIDSRTFFRDFWSFFQKNMFNIYRISPFGAVKIDSYDESLECFSTTNYIAINQYPHPETY